MLKLQLYMLDDDLAFIDRFLSFLAQTKLNDKLNIKIFTKYDLFVHHLEKEGYRGVLFISEKFETQWQSGNFPHPVIWLIEYSSNDINLGKDEQRDLRLYRYQPFPQLYTNLLSGILKSDQFNAHSRHTLTHTKIITFYSTVGHSGKTLTSLALAKQLSFRGKKVFMLNLEEHSSVNKLMSWPTNQNFSSLLYYVRSSPQIIASKVALFTSHDSITNISYISPSQELRELQEIQHDDITQLIETLVSLDIYDYILIDLPTTLHERTLSALTLSHHIFWIILDDLSCLHKTISLQKEINYSHKAHFIVNKYTGNLYNDYLSAGIHIAGYLPYMPEWKTMHAPTQFSNHSHFEEHVFEVFRQINESNLRSEGVSNEWNLTF